MTVFKCSNAYLHLFSVKSLVVLCGYAAAHMNVFLSKNVCTVLVKKCFGLLSSVDNNVEECWLSNHFGYH